MLEFIFYKITSCLASSIGRACDSYYLVSRIKVITRLGVRAPRRALFFGFFNILLFFFFFFQIVITLFQNSFIVVPRNSINKLLKLHKE